ncbi:transmembrane protein, putative (macronuclear) [Tetrahymena thermophila SB210]|uniref:Transmembrane protein, putative n=1 Tax=Tetrahymena thermophila (strain SB210) TaxID=312017 RepID=Q23NE5_TETTS|nr:transmembrane protein, putative [Tetrahymena thermophila SB210]EAR98037.2 transmembrane protein, putative [Tetrahymena thermophila SB210]|eukprot:XP_001018282.2 transmembrane protein, putative [Tetrahymena thermophila SB210]
MKIREISLISLNFSSKNLEEDFGRHYASILKIQFHVFTAVSLLIFFLVLIQNQISYRGGIYICVCLFASIIFTQILLNYVQKNYYYLMMPINSLFISLMLFKIYSYDQIQMQANFIKEFALISLLLVNTHKLYINFLNLTAIKISECLILNNKDSNQVLYSVQFTCSIILIMVIMYAKLYFLRHLYIDSQVGKCWSDIVNQNLNQKVFTTTYNKQTGKLELYNYNQACLKDINKDSTTSQSKFQEIFNRYLQNFRFNISDCLVYRPRSEIADKCQMIDLKQYLVNRHIHQLNQQNDKQTSFTKLSENNSTNKNSVQLKQIQNQDLSFQKNNSSTNNNNNNKSSQNHGKQVEQIQAQFYDMKSNTNKTCRIKIIQNSLYSSSQLLVIIEDESYLQDLSRYKQEKQTIERFLFSLMQNFQEKLRYIIWGLENSDQQISKIESYILINQVYCIFDYFIIKSKKLRNKFNQQISKKISKILNVENFTWQSLMKELVSLFCDMTIVSDIDFEAEEISLFQDRRKLKQVLIALLSLAQCRAVETYELKISRIKKKEWNAILLMVIFQTNDKPSDYKKKFYEFLNGNSISALNEVEYEVLKETVMIIGPYQINEEISDNGLVQISFAFFEDLEVIYESISSQVRKTENQPREDAMIRNLMSPKNQELLAATYDQYVSKIKERQRKSKKRIAIMEVSSKSKNNCDEISSSSEDEISQDMEIKSIDDKFFCLTSLSENHEKVQAIPDVQSFKKMNKFKKTQSNLQLTTIEQQLALNSPTLPTEEQIMKQPNTKTDFKYNQKRSSTLLINAKFSQNYQLNNGFKSFLKNSKISQYFNHGNQNKSKIDQENIDLTLKMQSSIYNQHISQYSSKVPYHQNFGQKSPIKQSSINQQIQIGNSINIDRTSLNLCRQLTENKIESFSPRMQHFSSFKQQGTRNSINSQRLSKFKTQEINGNYYPKDNSIDFKKQSINSLLKEFNKNFEQQSHNQDKCDNFSLYLQKN